MEIISAASILWNNQNIPIVPNSFKFTLGKGEVSSKAASAGGFSVVKVDSVNVETMLSKCSFSLYSTKDNVDIVKQMKKNISANVITAVDNNSGFTATFQSASISNDPEINLSSDGVIDLEFMTLPVL